MHLPGISSKMVSLKKISVAESTIKGRMRVAAMAHACNPSTLEGQGGQIMRLEVQDCLTNIVKPCLY